MSGGVYLDGFIVALLTGSSARLFISPSLFTLMLISNAS